MAEAPPPDALLAPYLDAARAKVMRERSEAPDLARRDRRAFRMRHRRLDSGRLYGQVFAPWQEEHFFAPIDAGKSLWSETGRGHDRTDGEGWCIVTSLQYGPPNQRGIIVAADQDQAALPLERCDRYHRDLPWAFPDVTVQKNEILGPNGSKCIVLSSDAASSLGEKPDWVWVEEIGVWPERGVKLWESIVGSCSKVGAPIRVLTNPGAGKQGNWRWAAREGFRALAAEHPDRYHFWRAPGWVAEWSRARIEELRRLFPSLRDQARFIDNEWLEQDENPAFLQADIDAALGIEYQTDGREVFVAGQAPSRIVAWVAASDFGLTGDALCIGALALCEDGSVWLFDDLALAGRPGDPASIATAEDHLLSVAARRNLIATVFDPTEAQGTIQRIGGRIRAEGDRWGPSLKIRIYKALLGKVQARKFHARGDAFRRTHANGQVYDLRREMTEAIEKATASGSYLMHPEGGHDDGLAVLQMAADRVGQCSLEPARVVTPDPEAHRTGWRDWRTTGSRTRLAR